MVTPTAGITDWSLFETPLAVIDFETTGLTPGPDRVVEVSVVRAQAGRAPELVFDSLVHPGRRVAATHVHGITDRDVADAPRFEDLAGDLVRALSGSVVAAYNAYFDMKFLDFELRRAGLFTPLPFVCLMYMRPLIGLGPRCGLDEACRRHGIPLQHAHEAAADALATAHLWEPYLSSAAEADLATFGDLARRKRYKFLQSFAHRPFHPADAAGVAPCRALKSRATRHRS